MNLVVFGISSECGFFCVSLPGIDEVTYQLQNFIGGLQLTLSIKLNIDAASILHHSEIWQSDAIRSCTAIWRSAGPEDELMSESFEMGDFETNFWAIIADHRLDYREITSFTVLSDIEVTMLGEKRMVPIANGERTPAEIELLAQMWTTGQVLMSRNSMLRMLGLDEEKTELTPAKQSFLDDSKIPLPDMRNPWNGLDPMITQGFEMPEIKFEFGTEDIEENTLNLLIGRPFTAKNRDKDSTPPIIAP